MSGLVAAGILGGMLWIAVRAWTRAINRDNEPDEWAPKHTVHPVTISPEARYNGACHNCKRRIVGDMIDWRNHIEQCGRPR